MDKASMVLQESQGTSISSDQSSDAAAYEVPVDAETGTRIYKAMPRRPGQPNFMDFFTPRRRPPIDQNVARYKALSRRPAEVQEVAPRQSDEETVLNGKTLTEPVAA